MIKFFDRFLFKELIKFFFIGVFIFVIILTVNTFYYLFNDRYFQLENAIKLLFFQIPSLLLFAFPMGYLFSIFLVLLRMEKYNKLQSFQTDKFGLIKFSLTILALSFLISLLTLFINEKITPKANYQCKMIYINMIKQNNEHVFIESYTSVEDLDYFASKELIEKKEKEVQENPYRLKELNEKKFYHYNKLSFPFTSFFISIFYIPIGMLFVKRNFFLGFFICISIIFFWNISFQLSHSLVIKSELDPLLASWIQNIFFAISGTFLFFNLSKKQF